MLKFSFLRELSLKDFSAHPILICNTCKPNSQVLSHILCSFTKTLKATCIFSLSLAHPQTHSIRQFLFYPLYSALPSLQTLQLALKYNIIHNIMRWVRWNTFGNLRLKSQNHFSPSMPLWLKLSLNWLGLRDAQRSFLLECNSRTSTESWIDSEEHHYQQLLDTLLSRRPWQKLYLCLFLCVWCEDRHQIYLCRFVSI